MQDFVGFRFGQVHSEDLHLIVVSSSNRYTKTLLPNLKDYTIEVPGGNGSYYFGQTFQTQEFSLNIAFDSVSENDWRRISNLFSNDKPQDLVFDEQPFKTYRAKLKQKPDFKFVCFIDKATGERVYKGEGTLNFVCYYPFAFGFNKYVVRAADYYKCLQPSQIITGAVSQNPYEEKRKRETIAWGVKKFYNVDWNMKKPWKGGYPSLEQVQQGELYFNDPVTNKRTMIDTRAYFDNVPDWEIAAKLLYTPTLDYDRDLIFMPQFSKTNYYNMDLGLSRENGVIGSRILVYNPGDMSIDFEIKLTGLFQKLRFFDYDAEDIYYSFRVSRYNVQRLTIEQAVDWCGLSTHDRSENITHKYGTRYFTVLENDGEGNIIKKDLGEAHPKHTYYVEPIPREKLGDFIRSFYWQTMQIYENGNISSEGELEIKYRNKINEAIGDVCEFWERGKEFANQYEEYRELCNCEEEEYELYWDTLNKAILSLYETVYFTDNLIEYMSFEKFKDNYINRGPEQLYRIDDNKYYGEYNFNLFTIPEYYTNDYLEINNNDFDKIFKHKCDKKDCNRFAEELDGNAIKPLFIDSERRMVYNIEEPEVMNTEDKFHKFYDYKPSKRIFNDNIERGHWFKIPPGWSLIDITPVLDENLLYRRRWNEARPFTWGSSDEQFRKTFDKAYEQAARSYLYQNFDMINNNSLLAEAFELKNDNTTEKINADLRKQILKDFNLEKLERLLPFRRWFNDDYYQTPENTDDSSHANYINNKQNQLERTFSLNEFKTILYKRELANFEYGFLKAVNDYWRVSKTDVNGLPDGTMEDWYWYANSYIWANFPPIFWAYMDLLNNAQIRYTPLFY